MKKVKNCTKLVPFFARDGRLRPKWTLFTLFGHYFKNTHSRHYVPLKDYIQMFMQLKGQPIPEFQDYERLCDFAFLIDISSHLNELNTRLQGKDQLISAMFDHINAFQIKLSLWESQLRVKNYDHFPIIRIHKVNDPEKYAKLISSLREEFNDRFQDFRNHSSYFSLFSSPFKVNIDSVAENLQMECFDMQCDSPLKDKFGQVSLLDFYKSYVSKENILE